MKQHKPIYLPSRAQGLLQRALGAGPGVSNASEQERLRQRAEEIQTDMDEEKENSEASSGDELLGEELSLLEKVELYLWLAKVGFLDLDLTDDSVLNSILNAFTQGSGDNAWDPVSQMANPRKITDTWELVDEDGTVVVRWTRTTFYMCFGDPDSKIGKGWVPAEERLKTEIFDPTYNAGISDGRTIWTNSFGKGGDG